MMEVARAEEVQPLSADPPTKEEGTEIAPEFLIKHPLQNSWKLWYLEPIKGASWEDMQKEITAFDTVEDFWSIYNHIKQASELKTGCDYSVFKSDIQPMWEHAMNKLGGRWLVTLDKRQRSSDLDRVWLDACLCLIGEAFDNAENVNGAVVNVRAKQDKVAVWVRDASNSAAVMEIGHKLKEKLKLRANIIFQLHKDLYKPASTTKAIYTL